MAKIDLLCKFKSLEAIIDKYGNAIEQLTTAYYELDNKCTEMESGQYWLGDAHDAYVSLYDGWKETFLRKLAGVIMFQTSLTVIQESLKSALQARNDLCFDISDSNDASSVSADEDAENVLCIHYENASSAKYEIGDSNPRFIDEIADLLNEAKSYFDVISSSDYAEITGVRSAIENYCTDLNTEKSRYTGFANSFYSFCSGIQAMESSLCSTVDSLFSDQLANMNSSQVEDMVMDYSLGCLNYDLSHLGISQEDAAFLVDLQTLFDTGEATKESVDALCDAYRGQGVSPELLLAIANGSWESYRDDKVEAIIMAGAAAVLGKTSTASAAELAEKSALIANQILKLSKKSDALIEKMGKKYIYYAEDGYHKTTLAALKTTREALEAQKDVIDAQIEPTKIYEKWGKVVPFAIIGVETLLSGAKKRFYDGLDWDDVCQDMADEAIAGVGGYVAGSITTVGITALAAIPQFAAVGTYAGPVGTVVGGIAGVVLAVSEPLHGFFEEATDWWDMLWW